MREEDIIRRKFGNKEPFTVPENYFADFAERLMDELPEKNAPVVHTPTAQGAPFALLAGYSGGALFCGRDRCLDLSEAGFRFKNSGCLCGCGARNQCFFGN